MKELEMLTATQRLTQYFSREFDRLNDGIKHQNNQAIQMERSIRISEVNVLSDTLNELFGALTSNPGMKLFPTYSNKTDWVQENVQQNQLMNKSEDMITLSPAQQRADQILQEYTKTTPRDIAHHLPEYDRPFEVLPGSVQTETLSVSEFSENNDLIHTTEGIPLEGNEIKSGEHKETRQGTDINLDEYLTIRTSSLVPGLIETDIRKLRTDYVENEQAVVVE